MTRAIITATGSALPAHIMSNEDWMKHVETSDEWIRSRTGIEQRHIAGDDESTATLAVDAAKAALTDVRYDGSEMDAIIVATSTPERTMPATACIVGKGIGNHGAFAFDISAACSGFIYGMQLAHQQIATGKAKRILVIGAETMSHIINWKDRGTCILFGDGAGAVIVEAQEGDMDATMRGIIDTQLHANGHFTDILKTEAGLLQMQGKEVFRHGVEKMAQACLEMLEKHGLTLEDVDWLIPHQANLRIIRSIAKKLELSEDKTVVTLDQHANTSAATIPLALDVAARDGRIQTGDLCLCPALGAGLTWGCCLIRW